MSTRTLLGAALATTVAGVVALVPNVASHAESATTASEPPRVAVDKQARSAAVDAARDYVSDRHTLFKSAPGDRFVRVAATPGSAGTFYVAYERTHRGLPVVGGDFVLAVNEDGKVTGRTTAQERVIRIANLRPSVRAASARATARKLVARVDSVGKPRLVVYAHGAPRLAWQTLVTGREAGLPSKLTVWTDARKGRVIASHDLVVEGTGNGYYNGTVTIGTSGSGSSWSMTDTSRSGQKCGGQNGAAYTGTDNVWGNGAASNLETACVDAMYAMNKEWDMLASWLGRSGIKGNGTGYPARVGLNDVNAYWDGSITNYGHSSDNARNLTAIDIVAHENGHGIFHTTPGGSSGDNETGGMNEATGDIFGAMTEAYAANPNDPADFLVGEEANLVGQGPIRNMYNPSALGDPNCWSTSIKNTEVHAAAGPLNHWFYLLSQGSNGSPSSPTCNGSTVTGLGLQTAGRIFYNGLLLKTSGWTHGAARKATLQAAVNLYGSTNCGNFNTVKAAWAAVSVPAQSGEATCGGTTPPPSSCSEVTNSGSVSQGYSSYKPSSSGFSAAAGTIKGCLSGPSGVDLDLYLQRWNGSYWVDVAASESASSTETITYSASAGYYRWDVYAYSGSGSFTLKYDVP
jgi:Zn-dependent metalloprotease